MDFLTIRELQRGNDFWSKLEDNGKIVITRNGKPSAIMIGVDSSSFEDTLAALMQVEAFRAIDRMRAISAENGNSQMSLEEINAEIAAARAGIE